MAAGSRDRQGNANICTAVVCSSRLSVSQMCESLCAMAAGSRDLQAEATIDAVVVYSFGLSVSQMCQSPNAIGADSRDRFLAKQMEAGSRVRQTKCKE